MNLTIDEIYNSIGQNMMVERGADNAIGFSGGYSSLNSKFTSFKFRNFDMKIVDEFHKLYTIMTEESDHHKWNKAKFKLTPDGKFSIDFDWDQKLADELNSF